MKYPDDFINKVICGDCLEVMKHIPDGSVDLVLTDIPYGEVNRESNGIQNFDKSDADIVNFELNDFLLDVNRLVKKSSYIFCGFQQFSDIVTFYKNNGFSQRCIVWEKTQIAPTNGEYIYLNGVELCAFGRKPKATFNAFCKNTVFKKGFGSSKWHPTEKPLDLIKEFVCDSSQPNDLILDPFLGSGTTAVACKQLGRRYIGIEINQEYCKIAEDRLRQEELF